MSGRSSEVSNEVKAYSISLFCTVHNISRTHLYELEKQGRGPRRMKVGRRVLIDVQAAADWREAMEVSERPTTKWRKAPA